ncbi:PREDICTED: ras association domain-containing protein 2-like, partial [Chlamydotis macqueenii]|uniref:ras association domain-containing protein 2-like n=1 Tax=Chlamydotis macqueenii TaxID=187382 RepID=UPI000529B99D
NVRINSTMTTPQVLKLLLNKFKIENSAEEFALYIVHTSAEKQKLRASDYPLIARILQGPCEQVSKVFLMEKDQVEEVTYDVAQYIKFEMPVLRSFIQKLEEEEDREVKKLMRKYSILRLMIEQRLEEIAEAAGPVSPGPSKPVYPSPRRRRDRSDVGSACQSFIRQEKPEASRAGGRRREEPLPARHRVRG